MQWKLLNKVRTKFKVYEFSIKLIKCLFLSYVKGSATVGLKSKTHAILLALKRSTSELSAHQKKIFPVDDHVGMSIAGLTADARVLSRYLRNECLNERFVHDQALPVGRLVSSLGNKMQACTQRYDRRPFGVGLLIAGYDEDGPHVFQTCPSANYFDCKAQSIGARSQSARTYLEKHLDEFLDSSLDQLIRHGLLSLRECLPNDLELNERNVSIAVVGKDTPFRVHDEDSINTFLQLLTPVERKGRSAASQAPPMVRPADQDPEEPEPRPRSPETEDHMAVD